MQLMLLCCRRRDRRLQNLHATHGLLAAVWSILGQWPSPCRDYVLVSIFIYVYNINIYIYKYTYIDIFTSIIYILFLLYYIYINNYIFDIYHLHLRYCTLNTCKSIYVFYDVPRKNHKTKILLGRELAADAAGLKQLWPHLPGHGERAKPSPSPTGGAHSTQTSTLR